MKIFLILALVLTSTKLLAIELPKDTLWSLQTGKYLFNNAFFSFDDKKIYVNTREGVLVLDAQKGDSLDYIGGINIGRESSDGSYFVSINPTDISNKENNVEKFDSKTKQLLWSCPKREKDNLLFVAFSQNAKYVLLIYSGSNLDIYNVETQEFVKSLHYNTFTFNYKGFAIDNYGEKIIITAPITRNGKFGEVSYLIEVATNKYLKEMYFAEGIQTEQSAMFSAQNNYALAKWQDYISVLDLRTMDSFVYTPSGGGGYGSRIGVMSYSENFIVSGGVPKRWAEIYDIKQKKVVYYAGKSYNGEYPYAEMKKNDSALMIISQNTIFLMDLQQTLSNETVETQLGINVIPNPTYNKLILSNPQNHQINTLTAYDILGRTYSLSANGNEVDVSGLALGRYFLKVGLADGSLLDFGFLVE